jgi:predicted acylesterase/phospholipase RssA
MLRPVILVATALCASACAVNRTSLPLARCTLDAAVIPLEVPGLEEGLAEAQTGTLSPEEDRMVQELMEAAQRRNLAEPQSPGAKEEIRQLILSGGGQWGSFGSGYLSAWARRDGDRLPSFDSVTGVSTGALQATLAFLGRDPPPADRTFPVSEDFPAGWQGSDERQYSVDDLIAGYTITKPETLYRTYGIKGIVRKATAGDLAPLEIRMKRIITPATLEAVAREGAKRRQLKVALVNWDTGQAVAVDMVKLASRFDGSNFAAVQTCYVQVLLAASSETLGMPPVRIGSETATPGQDNGDSEGLYFDAGIRFGVFADKARALGRAAAARLEEEGGPDTIAATYIIANNDLHVSPIEDKKRPKYNALDLMGRARQILVNQIYLMSVERIFAASEEEEKVRFAFVDSGVVKVCGPIKVAQKAELGDKPFYPKFMQCLMAEGKKRGAAGKWNNHPVP